jgi:hypothetical protein
MDASDAMEVTEPTSAVISNVEEDNVEQNTTNESAMEQLSLEPSEVPVGSPDATYNASPSTNQDSPLGPDNEAEQTVNEKDTVNEERENDVDNSKPRSEENTVPTLPPQNQEKASLNPLLLLANASTALATEANTDETTIDTEMEEATQVIPEPTAVEAETPNTPVPAEPPSIELATDNVMNNDAPSPTATAMEEDGKRVPPPNVNPESAGDSSTKAPSASGWGLDADGPEKSKGADTDGWGTGAAEKATDGGGWSLNEKTEWGAGAGGGGGDSNSNQETNAGPTNGGSGFGGRGGWVSRGRDNGRGRGSHWDRDMDRDTYRDGDGLRRNRPTSFGNGSGAPPFASGSNAELLPPLGRSPVKNGDRHARLARSAPYPPRRETRSADWGLDYGSAGDGEELGTVVVSQKPVVLKEVDIGGLDTLSKMMSNADIKAITNSLMDHIGRIQKSASYRFL